MKNTQNKNLGFIALISVVIISFVLLLVAITLSMKSFSVRMNIADSESKKTADEIAYACIEHARLLLVVDNTINDLGGVHGTINIGTESCTYDINQNNIINAQSIVNNAYTNYRATVNENNPQIPILDFEEITVYP